MVRRFPCTAKCTARTHGRPTKYREICYFGCFLARSSFTHQPIAVTVSADVDGALIMPAARAAVSPSGNLAVQNRPVVSVAARSAAALSRFCLVPGGSRAFDLAQRRHRPKSTKRPSYWPWWTLVKTPGRRQQAHTCILFSGNGCLPLQRYRNQGERAALPTGSTVLDHRGRWSPIFRTFRHAGGYGRPLSPPVGNAIRPRS